MNIVVSGGWSYGNIGDEVICMVTRFLLERYFPSDRVMYSSYNPADFIRCQGIDAIKSVHAILSNFNDKYTVRQILEDPDVYGLKQYMHEMYTCDLFVMSGGGYFIEDWYSNFVSRIIEIHLAKQAGAKVVLIGQSIGPITSKQGTKDFRIAMNLCDFISVRDKASKDFIESCGIDNTVYCNPDLAVIISDILPGRKKEKMITIAVQDFVPYQAQGRKIMSTGG